MLKEKEIKRIVDMLSSQEKRILINYLSKNNNISNGFEVIEFNDTIDGIDKKVIVGFYDYAEIEAEKKRLSTQGQKCKIVEIRWRKGYGYDITNNFPESEYDLEKIVNFKYENEAYFEWRIFDFEQEVDGMKQSVEYHIGENEFNEANMILGCFVDIYEKYKELSDDEILVHDGGFVEYEIVKKKAMEWKNFGYNDENYQIGLLMFAE